MLHLNYFTQRCNNVLELNIWNDFLVRFFLILFYRNQSLCILAAENSVLIATDVAARGLDIKGIENVIHYQIPRSAEVCL